MWSWVFKINLLILFFLEGRKSLVVVDLLSSEVRWRLTMVALLSY
jgi:hypothetical protein